MDGKSTGAEVIFPIVNSSSSISAFTTHIETIMGVSFIGLAATHPLVIEQCQKDPQLQQFVILLSFFHS